MIVEHTRLTTFDLTALARDAEAARQRLEARSKMDSGEGER
jgi:hypothetical protein